MSTPKEKVYDAEISPLMAQIIAICKREHISMAAQFCLGTDDGEHLDSDDEEWRTAGEPLRCTTVLDFAGNEQHERDHILALHKIMYPRLEFAAFTIVSGAAKDGAA